MDKGIDVLCSASPVGKLGQGLVTLSLLLVCTGIVVHLI